MSQSRSEFFRGAPFDRFLQARIGEDRNGTLLTVLSALARLDVDPWEEAEALARLPRVAAARKLDLLLASLPNRPIGDLDSGTDAVRLIALLPERTPADAAQRAGPAGVATVPQSPLLRSLILYLIVMLLMFTCEWLVTNSKSPTAATGAAAPPASSAPAAVPAAVPDK
jgi:hypothetical protein